MARSIFTQDVYTRNQDTLLNEYVTNMTNFLQRKYPHQSKSFIQKFIRDHVEKNIHNPNVALADYPSPGNEEKVVRDLISHGNIAKGDNILCPSGTAYYRPNKKKSLYTDIILKNKARRNYHKKLMLEAAGQGDEVTRRSENGKQASCKIENNSLSGAAASPHNAVYDPPNYNAITATARHSIMVGYGDAERFLEGNHYFATYDDVINYILLIDREYPGDEAIKDVISEYSLKVPPLKDVVKYFTDCLKFYVFKNHTRELTEFLSLYSEYERTFIFYALCLKNVIRYNPQYFKPFFKDLFNQDNISVDNSIDTAKEFKTAFRGDFSNMLLALTTDKFEGRMPKDQIALNPQNVNEVIAIGKYMENLINGKLTKLIHTFFVIDVDLPRAIEHKGMIRRTVVQSDTDSVIFSLKHWIKWYCGDVCFTKDAYDINAFIVYCLVMRLEHTFAIMSTNMGMIGEDIYTINMKNEFLFDTLVATPRRKHYAGPMSYQEGIKLPKLKYDIKGKGLRGSDLVSETKKLIDSVLKEELFKRFTEGKKSTSEHYIKLGLDYEHSIMKEIKSGSVYYFGKQKIKPKEEYAAEWESTPYFYYDLWNKVFKDKYGTSEIPNKWFKLPIALKGKLIRDPQYIAYLETINPTAAANLCDILNDYKKKDITYLVMPTHINEVPKEILPIVDKRSLIFENMSSIFLIFNAIGINISSNKTNPRLLSDMYAYTDAKAMDTVTIE